jgi:hypothetical protein
MWSPRSSGLSNGMAKNCEINEKGESNGAAQMCERRLADCTGVRCLVGMDQLIPRCPPIGLGLHVRPEFIEVMVVAWGREDFLFGHRVLSGRTSPARIRCSSQDNGIFSMFLYSPCCAVANRRRVTANPQLRGTVSPDFNPIPNPRTPPQCWPLPLNRHRQYCGGAQGSSGLGSALDRELNPYGAMYRACPSLLVIPDSSQAGIFFTCTNTSLCAEVRLVAAHYAAQSRECVFVWHCTNRRISGIVNNRGHATFADAIVNIP